MRSASLNQKTKTLEVTGDIDNSTTTIKVFASRKACSVSWNGKKLVILSKEKNLITATVTGPTAFSLPDLGPWKYHDSLPEIDPEYKTSAEAWVGELNDFSRQKTND